MIEVIVTELWQAFLTSQRNTTTGYGEKFLRQDTKSSNFTKLHQLMIEQTFKTTQPILHHFTIANRFVVENNARPFKLFSSSIASKERSKIVFQSKSSPLVASKGYFLLMAAKMV